MSRPSEAEAPTRPLWRRLVTPRTVVFVLVLAVSIAFVVKNEGTVQMDFVFFTVTTRLWVGFVLCLLFGAILGRVGTMFWRHRGKK